MEKTGLYGKCVSEFLPNKVGWRVCSPNSSVSLPGNNCVTFCSTPWSWVGPCDWVPTDGMGLGEMHTPSCPGSSSTWVALHVFSAPLPTHHPGEVTAQSHGSLYQSGSFNTFAAPAPSPDSPQPTTSCGRDRKYAFIILSQWDFVGHLWIALGNTGEKEQPEGRKEDDVRERHSGPNLLQRHLWAIWLFLQVSE